MTGFDNLRAHQDRVEQQNIARLEDVQWFLETGESLAGAAKRLGITSNALEKWMARRGMFTEVNTLRARDPLDPTVCLGERGRAGAAARWAS